MVFKSYMHLHNLQKTVTMALLISMFVFLRKAGAEEAYQHADEPIGTIYQLYDGTLTPDLLVNTLRNIDRLFPTRIVEPADRPRPFKRLDRQIMQVTFEYKGMR